MPRRAADTSCCKEKTDPDACAGCCRTPLSAFIVTFIATDRCARQSFQIPLQDQPLALPHCCQLQRRLALDVLERKIGVVFPVEHRIDALRGQQDVQRFHRPQHRGDVHRGSQVRILEVGVGVALKEQFIPPS